MSRIGKAPVTVPKGVTVTIGAGAVEVKGPKGNVTVPFPPSRVRIAKEGDTLQITPASADKTLRAIWGTTTRLLANAVHGASEGYAIDLAMTGVGYRAQVQGQKIQMTLGFSHPITYALPAGIKAEVADQTKIKISGARKDLVGQVAAEIRALRPPEPYKGKGIRRGQEVIRRKAGKSAAAAK